MRSSWQRDAIREPVVLLGGLNATRSCLALSASALAWAGASAARADTKELFESPRQEHARRYIAGLSAV